MDTADVPTALRQRLGDGATAGLVELLDNTKREWSADVIAILGQRFERRLVEETFRLRVEMAEGFASVRVEMAEGFASMRTEMRTGLAEGLASVRREMAEGFGVLRGEMGQQRVELLKWAFLLWVGQFVAMAGLLLVVVRLLGPDL